MHKRRRKSIPKYILRAANVVEGGAEGTELPTWMAVQSTALRFVAEQAELSKSICVPCSSSEASHGDKTASTSIQCW